MKKCERCGSLLPDESIFCLTCGAIMAEDAPIVSPEEIPSTVFDPVEIAPEPVADAPITAPIEQKQPKKKKRKVKLIWKILAAVGVLAIIAFLIIGYVTNWFGGPLGGLYRAFNRTIQADNFRFKYDVTVMYTGGIGNATPLEQSVGGEFKVAVDREHRILTVIGQMHGNDTVAEIMIRDGMLYSMYEEDDGLQTLATERIPQETLDAIFDILNGKISDDDALRDMMELYQIEASIDDVRDFIKTLEKECFTDQAWLQEYLGYKRSGNRYHFSIDMRELMKELADRAYDADIISKSQKKVWSSQQNYTIEVECEVKDGYLTKISCAMDTSYVETKYSIELWDIDRSAISDAEVNAFQTSVDEYIAANYAECSHCGTDERKSGMAYMDGNYYCSGCSASLGKCGTCGTYDYKDGMTYLNGQHYCAICFEEYTISHTCPKCNMLTGAKGMCFNHNWYGGCAKCGSLGKVAYYNVLEKEYICLDCCE